MGAVRIWVGAVLRRRWRATVVLSLLVGVAGAAALGAAAGARRTQTAFPRMRVATHASDLLVSVGGSGLEGFYDAVGRLPEVRAAGVMAGIPLAPFDEAGDPDPAAVIPSASTDGRALTVVDRPNILDGRAADPGAADEILVDPAAARVLGVGVGDRLPMALFTSQEGEAPAFVRITLRVVGIGVTAPQVVPTTPLDRRPQVFLPVAFFRSQPSLASRENLNYDGVFVRLRPGTDIPAFERKVSALAGTFPETFGGAFIQNLAQTADREQRAILPIAVSLYLFAALIGVAIFFVLGQAIARQQQVEAEDHETLRALGFTRGQTVAVSLARVAVVAVGGAAAAAALALAASPFMPIGPARRAETRPGFEANAAVVGIGAAAIVVLLLLRALLPALRAASVARGLRAAPRRSAVAAAAGRAGLSPPVVVGVRLAFEQYRGTQPLPLRSALAGTVVGIAALLAALMFGSSLTRLVDVPAAYGQRWDVVADSGFGSFPPSARIGDLARDPDIAGVTAGNYGSVSIGARDVPAVGLDVLAGDVYPDLLEGRPAEHPDEIVLGTTVMRLLGTTVGRTVQVTLAGEQTPRAMRVVGRAVFPTFGRGSFAPTSLGDGAAVLAGDFEAHERALNPTIEGPPYNFLLIRFRPGADRAALLERLTERFTSPDCRATDDCNVTFDQRPIELGILRDVRSAPLVMAGLLALFAAATLGHALVTSVRMRRRDLAVLKTIGFVRRQIRATVAWQTSALAAAALALGVPLGVAGGRGVWSVFASSLGIPPVAVVPTAFLAAAVPATLLLANAIGTLPARAAARTEAAVVLRTE